MIVLVCGNNTILSDLVSRNLMLRGYQVSEQPLPSEDADGPLDMRGADIVVVDLDCQEPELWRRAASVRTSMRGVPLVILGHGWPIGTQLDRLRPCKYVRKPFAIEQLVAAVREAPMKVT